VSVERFALRRGSGGAGRHRGGDGLIREIKFHEAMTAAILSGRRTTRPFGLAGGSDGLPGETTLMRADGTRETLGATGSAEVNPGDVITIATPGGGGFGAP
jgi:5-oxoprolinase (ATP-hydrolysing)